MKKSIILFSLCCSFNLFAKKAEPTTFYQGEVAYFAADGTTSYGTKPSLLQRSVRPKEGLIVEAVTQPSAQTGIVTYVATLTREGNTNQFSATDEGKTFSGIITYQDAKEWEWTDWSYTFSISGGTLVGTGKMTKDSIETEKKFLGKDLKPLQVIREKYNLISAKKYDKLLKEMKGN